MPAPLWAYPKGMLMRTLGILIACGALLAVACQGGSNKPSPIHWAASYDAAVKDAKAKNKLVMIKFYADWCGPCKEMESTTFSDDKVVAEVEKNFVPVKVDIDTPEGAALQNKMGGVAIPYVVFAKPSGEKVASLLGMTDSTEFLVTCRTARSAK